MEDVLNTLMNNVRRYRYNNPDVDEAVKNGFDVAMYDEETGMVVVLGLAEEDQKSLRIQIFEDGRFIPKEDEVE